ncbi:hypothetical protein KSC_028550 [Ktedonobacter sp. SOSP1-52]|uniref:DUF2071 domain-containing protein n=1 Tax=Ktedonobacter sp. SOSP1-52 TaxID=2778366 RepID=UPI001915D6BC|nr:DUF2071 domain-containing protein [Ktedonobacter sp. SOSP1-52]GHO63963.1 hypothetical protein KSC_028550 [Ktedonobacter sp. SOSP1-52]
MLRTRTVKARLLERFIFNFRVRPEVLARHLPVTSLYPQVFHGWSVVSFCILKLDRVTLVPLPSRLGLETISCAYRCGVIDITGTQPMSSVYILRRYTDRSLISSLGPWVFADPIAKVRASLTQDGTVRTIRVHHDGQCLFSASFQPSLSPCALDSHVFDSLDAFAHFMDLGVASYTPAIALGALARVDLQKSETHYMALQATVEYSFLDDLWYHEGLIFDSAVQATGGAYEWTYQGLVKRSCHPCFP